MVRHGKVARLPEKVRQELNERLADNEPAEILLAWLNGLPAVANVLARDFAGAAISEQNLSAWRLGGFKEWQAREVALACARELAGEADQLRSATEGYLLENLVTALSARYALLLNEFHDREPADPEAQFRWLRGLRREVLALRRSEQWQERVQLAREEWDRKCVIEDERKKAQAQSQALFAPLYQAVLGLGNQPPVKTPEEPAPSPTPKPIKVAKGG